MTLGGLDQSSASGNERPANKRSASLAPLRLGGNPPEERPGGPRLEPAAEREAGAVAVDNGREIERVLAG